MNTGDIQIVNSSVIVRFTDDNTIWLTKHQMADFFDVFVSAISSNLKSIFDKKILTESEVSYIHTNESTQTIYYNFELLVCITYYLNSPNAGLFRDWLRRRTSKSDIPDEIRAYIRLFTNNQIN